MENLSQLISKKVFSLASGNEVGYVLNVVLDDHLACIQALIIVDEESELEAEVMACDVVVKGEHLFLTAENKITYGQEKVRTNPIGKHVFTQKGEDCGKIKDVRLEKFKVKLLLTDKMAFLPKHIGVWGKDALILGKRKKKPQFSQPVFEAEKQQLVSINATQAVRDVASAPFRITTDAKNLIGKIATRDIFGLNNELIIKKFEIITQKKLNDAKKHNKLNILFYNCK